MAENPVYLDHNATTPVSAGVLSRLSEWAAAWGNPSSIHARSRDPKRVLRETRQVLADFLGCSPLELVFTSGGSESNNTVLKGLWAKLGRERPHIMCSAVEHPSVLRTMQWLGEQGAEVDIIPVSRDGRIDLEFYRAKLGARTLFVSVMAANNETGTLFPVREMAGMAHAKGALFHCDAVQMFGKLPVDLAAWNVDYASFSAHKFYSLKGTGVLYVKRNSPYEPLIHGGGQERHRRGGTENTLGIAALGQVVSEAPAVAAEGSRIAALRDHFEARVLAEIPASSVTAALSPRLPNTSSLVLDGVDGETLLMSLDLQGYAVSTGAACSSGNPEPSPVLLALGLSRQEAQNSLRVSFGRGNDLAQVDAFVEILKFTVQRLRQLQNNTGVRHA
ncbi:MAG: cysteine desulfurase [Bdellovibrionaceae bacterium]|nr:cysteine desulfurase [Pseudobdellovibrionaceae bacterium]